MKLQVVVEMIPGWWRSRDGGAARNKGRLLGKL